MVENGHLQALGIVAAMLRGYEGRQLDHTSRHSREVFVIHQRLKRRCELLGWRHYQQARLHRRALAFQQGSLGGFDLTRNRGDYALPLLQSRSGRTRCVLQDVEVLNVLFHLGRQPRQLLAQRLTGVMCSAGRRNEMFAAHALS
jgi:hypothetical protein